MNEKEYNITTLFLDIGGVILTDGWNRDSRKRAAEHFHLDHDQFEDRHRITFDTFEIGKISLEVYLERVVFYEKRSFTLKEFTEFMFSESKIFGDLITLIPKLKKQYGLKVGVVSNEGLELTEYRIKKFKLNDFIDFFVSSCFVNLRKPDEAIFKLALDLAQVPPEQIIYIENTQMFIEIGQKFGMNTILHTDYSTSLAQLESFGLKLKEV